MQGVVWGCCRLLEAGCPVPRRAALLRGVAAVLGRDWGLQSSVRGASEVRTSQLSVLVIS